jgi:hypothetical protein
MRAGPEVHSCGGMPAAVAVTVWTVRGRSKEWRWSPMPGTPRCRCVRACQSPVLIRGSGLSAQYRRPPVDRQVGSVVKTGASPAGTPVEHEDHRQSSVGGLQNPLDDPLGQCPALWDLVPQKHPVLRGKCPRPRRWSRRGWRSASSTCSGKLPLPARRQRQRRSGEPSVNVVFLSRMSVALTHGLAVGVGRERVDGRGGDQ